MSALLVLAVYLTQIVAGLVVVELLHGRGAFHGGGPGRRFARALLLGPAAIALELMAFHALGVPIALPFALVPWWLAALALARRLVQPPAERDEPTQGFERALAAVALAGFAVLLFVGTRFPVYRGDEVNNFAVNARVFEVHRSLAPDALNGLIENGHPEYPPLVALNETLLFQAEGDTLGFAAKPFFSLAWLAWALLVVEAVRKLAPPLAVCAALLAMLVPELASFATRGMADLRLTATMLLLVLEARAFLRNVDERRARRAGAVAAAAVAAALTKNEGVAIATLATLALAPFAVRVLGARRAGLGALATLALVWTWPVFKAVHDIRDVYLGAAKPGLHLDQLGTIARELARLPFGSELGTQPSWGVLWLAAGIAAGIGFWSRTARRELGLLGLGLAVHVALYAAVFSATPHDLRWHLSTAGPRLLFHTAPWLVLILAAGLGAGGRRPGTDGGRPGTAG
jgi:hypothetical protein